MQDHFDVDTMTASLIIKRRRLLTIMTSDRKTRRTIRCGRLDQHFITFCDLVKKQLIIYKQRYYSLPAGINMADSSGRFFGKVAGRHNIQAHNTV